MLERFQAKSKFLENWDPRDLPAVRDPNRIFRSVSVVELVGISVFCVWWIAAMHSRVVLDHPGVRITLAPSWPFFFWGYLLLSLACLGISGVNFVRPYWTPRRAILRLLVDGAGLALLGVLLKSNILAELWFRDLSAGRASELTQAINLWLSRAVPFVALVGLVILAIDARRIRRAKSGSSGVAAGLASGGLPAART
jgi:hypothetical protein